MTLTYYKDYQELLSTCNGFWDLRGNVLPIVGTVTGTITSATTTTNRFGETAKAYAFSGSTQYITFGNTAVSIKSLLFWVKLTSTTQSILKLTDTPHKITISSGTIAATGWPATVVIYVDGAVSSTISDANWHCVCITTSGTAFAASNLIIGYDGTGYLTGSMNEVLTFSTQLSAVEVKTLYNLMSKKALYGTMSGIRAVE
jgi:hypothetical protein